MAGRPILRATVKIISPSAQMPAVTFHSLRLGV